MAPTPGPGNYNHSTTLSGPKYVMGSRVAKSAEGTPGPCHYKQDRYNYITSGIQVAPRFSIGTEPRVTIKELNKNPGPGIYQSKGQLEGPKYGFGSSSRMPIKEANLPGPGQYKVTT